jgi:hypothetical protein
VMTFSASSIDRLLFGSGLGGVISSPVSGGDEWRFVHNMFAYYLFKTGLFGLIFYSFFFLLCYKTLIFIVKLFVDVASRSL